MFSFITKFSHSFANVTKATARHMAFRAEVAAASKMDFAKGYTKDVFSNIALGASVKTILTADQQGIVDHEVASTTLGAARGIFRLHSLKNQATEMVSLFSDAKQNFQYSNFEKLVINGFSLSKMIFGAMLPGTKMGLSLFASAYSAGVNSAYSAYEKKMIGHLEVVDDEAEDLISVSSVATLNNDYNSNFDQDTDSSVSLIGVT